MYYKMLIQKEIWDGWRNYRFLIVSLGIAFFAIMNPVLDKLVLPSVLRSQFPNMPSEALDAMLLTTQIESIIGYFGSVFQVGILIMVFVLSGIVAQELTDRTFVLSVSTGKKYQDLILAKLIVYGTLLVSVTTISALVNYLYTGLFFGFDLPSPIPMLRAGMLQGVFMIFVLSMLNFIGSLVKKPMTTGLVVFMVVVGLRVIGGLLDIHGFLPTGLLVEGELLTVAPSLQVILQSLIITVLSIFVLIKLTITRLNKMDITQN